MKYIMSIDAGTTSCRAILFSKNVTIKSIAKKEFTQIFPQPGWVEHDPLEIWSTQIGVMLECLAKSGVYAKDVVALGISNQRETLVIWDKNTGAAIYNAIVWQDRRTASYCNELKEQGWLGKIKNKTGLIIDSYFSATKIKWILDNVEGAREKANQGQLLCGTIDTWIIWNLTAGKVHATDYSNASRTMLFNIIDGKWDDELLELFNIPRSILPTVKQSSDDYGYVSEELIPCKIPIRGVSGDQQAATFGQACLKSGMAKNTYGTGCFALLNIGKQVKTNSDNLLTTIAWARKDSITYALEGSVFIGGSVVHWLRDGLGIIKHSDDVEKLALSEKDSAGVMFVPAFVGIGAPYWDSYARGMMIGLTRGTTSGHIARAALESIAFQSYDILKAMEDTSGIAVTELRVDGGASLNNFLMQFQSNLLNKPVIRPKIVETTALGVAYLAGLYECFWDSADEIVALWQVDAVFEPQINESQRDELVGKWHQAVERSLQWAD